MVKHSVLKTTSCMRVFLQIVLFIRLDEVTYQVTQVRLLLVKYRTWRDCSLFASGEKNTVHMALMSVKLEMVMQIR